MKLFPIFLDLEAAPVLVIGGGETAVRKVRLLLKANADIRVVTDMPNAELLKLGANGEVIILRRHYKVSDLDDVSLVISATDVYQLDLKISRLAKTRDIPVNVPDQPGLSSFVMPAIVDRSPIVIAIGSGGSAPVLVRNIREKIEGLLPARLGILAKFADNFRDAVKAMRPRGSDRRTFWEHFFDSSIADHVLYGRDSTARKLTFDAVNNPKTRFGFQSGHVTIIGTGPGDPDLLTFRAVHVMQRADVVLYDNLVSKDVLEYVRRDAERVFVGKKPGNHRLSQKQINELMIEHARAGHQVARLKGGDPFMFGRGGEELEALRGAGISVKVVPGITAAAGCAASADIPLTHRDHTQAVTFLTGHIKDGGLDLDWRQLVTQNQTLVVYMGVETSDRLSSNLIHAGMDPQTPVAVIENGTRVNERVLRTILQDLPKIITEQQVQPPALIVVGSVVSIAAQDTIFQVTQTAQYAVGT